MTHLSQAQIAVSIRDIALRYPATPEIALQADLIRICQGQRVALVGPNGAGKSTLLKAIVGLLPLERGTVSVFGKPVGSLPHDVAYVPQRREVDWRFPITTLDLALMGRDVHLAWPRWPRQTDRRLAFQALEAVGMADKVNIHIADLSGGQQQRVFLARAIAQQAKLLLLDEPFIGVDAVTQAILFHIIDVLCHQGCTVVVATHDLVTIQEQFDAAILLRREVIASGPAKDVLRPDILAKAYGDPLALFEERTPHGIDF